MYIIFFVHQHGVRGLPFYQFNIYSLAHATKNATKPIGPTERRDGHVFVSGNFPFVLGFFFLITTPLKINENLRVFLTPMLYGLAMNS